MAECNNNNIYNDFDKKINNTIKNNYVTVIALLTVIAFQSDEIRLNHKITISNNLYIIMIHNKN